MEARESAWTSEYRNTVDAEEKRKEVQRILDGVPRPRDHHKEERKEKFDNVIAKFIAEEEELQRKLESPCSSQR